MEFETTPEALLVMRLHRQDSRKIRDRGMKFFPGEPGLRQPGHDRLRIEQTQFTTVLIRECLYLSVVQDNTQPYRLFRGKLGEKHFFLYDLVVPAPPGKHSEFGIRGRFGGICVRIIRAGWHCNRHSSTCCRPPTPQLQGSPGRGSVVFCHHQEMPLRDGLQTRTRHTKDILLPQLSASRA